MFQMVLENTEVDVETLHKINDDFGSNINCQDYVFGAISNMNSTPNFISQDLMRVEEKILHVWDDWRRTVLIRSAFIHVLFN